jgi:hypothetical protein
MRCLRELEVAGDVGFPYLLRVLEFKYNTCKKEKKKSCEIDNQDVPLGFTFIYYPFSLSEKVVFFLLRGQII